MTGMLIKHSRLRQKEVLQEANVADISSPLHTNVSPSWAMLASVVAINQARTTTQMTAVAAAGD